MKATAAAWLDEMTSAHVTGTYVPPKAGRVTVRAYANDGERVSCIASARAEGVEAILRLHVCPALGAMPLETVETSDVEPLVRVWALFASAATVETRFRILAAVFGSAVRDRLLPHSPCEGVRLPRKSARGALSPIGTETVLALRDAMPAHLQAFVTVGAGTGMRRS
jgi:hypothetical protein